MPSNLRGGWHEHLALKITSEYYAAQTGLTFVPPHNLGDCPPTIVNAQYQALFRKYTAVDGAFKKQIITAVEPVFLFSLVDQITVLRQVSTLPVLNQFFSSYGVIDKIDLDENYVKIIGPFNPAKPPGRLI